MSVTIKLGPGGKVWDWYMILHYFVEYLTPMLTLDPHSNLVLDLKMWENLESNLPLCACLVLEMKSRATCKWLGTFFQNFFQPMVHFDKGMRRFELMRSYHKDLRNIFYPCIRLSTRWCVYLLRMIYILNTHSDLNLTFHSEILWI